MSKDLDTRAIAERLKQVRAELRLSQSEAAALLSVPFRTYQGYEGGERDVSASFLDNLNRAFGVNPLWLLRGEGYKKGLLSRHKIIEILAELLDRWAAEHSQRENRDKAEDFVKVIAFIEANTLHAPDQVLDLVAPKLTMKNTDKESDAYRKDFPARLIENAVKKAGGVRALARELGWNPGSMMKAREKISPYRAAQLAQYLGVNAAPPLMAALAAGSKSEDEAAFWANFHE